VNPITMLVMSTVSSILWHLEKFVTYPVTGLQVSSAKTTVSVFSHLYVNNISSMHVVICN
ncbi:C-type lectin mannose-binding isoform, partial [Biomphalaria pfeifferi]